MKTIIKYSDSAHGWIKVKKCELKKLGILQKISGCSYARKDYTYLEEDLDASIYLIALKDSGIDYKIIYKDSCKRSKIRSYESFNLNKEA